jgi:hypothetical protein
VLKSGSLNLPETLRACPGVYRNCFFKRKWQLSLPRKINTLNFENNLKHLSKSCAKNNNEIFEILSTIISSILEQPQRIQEEIKNSLQSGNVCFHLVQNILSSSLLTSLLTENMEIKMHRNVISPVVLYGCEIWSLTSRKGRRLRVFENRVLRRIIGSKRDEVTGE